MSHKAVLIYDQYSKQAREKAKSPDLMEACKKRSKAGLELVAPWVASLLELSGQTPDAALSRAVSPDAAFMVECAPERILMALFDAFDYEEAKRFNETPEIIENIPADNLGLLAIWAMEDGSALCCYTGGPQQIARELLQKYEFKVPNALDRLWPVGVAPHGERVAEALNLARESGDFVCALEPKYAFALGKGIAVFESVRTRDGLSWRRGMTFKGLNTGNVADPDDLQRNIERVLDAQMDALRKSAQKRLDDAKKEREAKSRVHWREAMCQFLAQASCQPVYDGGIAAFLMSKPTSFGQFPASIWSKVFSDVIEIIKPLGEGESPEITSIENASIFLGSDLSSQLAHFLYRYHRTGGAKLLAIKMLEEKKEKIMGDQQLTGLAAALKPRAEKISDEARELAKSAGSLEFAVQYGSALALNTAIWASETGFENIEDQARAFVRAIRGTDEVSLECFGWFARLIYEFSEGFVSKDNIEKVLMMEMDELSRAADAQRAKGGRITIENESSSGAWSQALARRKIREYLGLSLQSPIQSPIR